MMFLGISANDWVPIIAAISAGIIFLSGLVAVVTSRSLARKTLTFQTLHTTLWDRDYQQFRRQWDALLGVVSSVNSIAELEEYYKTATDEFFVRRSKSLSKHLTNGAMIGADPSLSQFDEKARNEIRDDDLSIIRAVLNDYELIAIGIRVGILDEEMCLRYMRGTVLSDWYRASQIIKSLRRKFNNNALLAEFDALAQRWESKTVKRPPLARFRPWPPPRD